MISFKNTYVSNFYGALRGLRNPLESWNKSDSLFGTNGTTSAEPQLLYVVYDYMHDNKNKCDFDTISNYLVMNGTNPFLSEDGDLGNYVFIGPNDANLARRMVLAGNDDGKFARQIFVSVDITAPLYYFKELDTYKVSTVANSTSTMHKLASTPITRDCFSLDCDLEDEDSKFNEYVDKMVNDLESLRQYYLKTNDKRYWRALIQLLPESWNQTRTWTANYQVLRNIYFARRNHKLQEWHSFCDWIHSLPYSDLLITCEKEKN